MRDHWLLDPAVAFLNHGSFGACPRVVFEAAQRTRARLEREPIRFLVGELEGLLDEARAVVARLLGADPDDLAFVPNATSGVNTVLRSLKLSPGDELLTTSHAYNACAQALEEVASLAGARVVVAEVPFPIASPSVVTEAVMAAVTPRTRLCLLDHVTSQTALIFPVREIVKELASRGVDTLVDAAHAPGMVPVALDDVGAAYTTGNFHKWICAPKSAAFLHVRRDRHASVRPLSVSHGRNAALRERSRFHLEHDWTGTFDPAPYLAVPEAIRFLSSLFPEGLEGWRKHNHASALRGRVAVADALGVGLPAPDEMIGSMASLVVPDTMPGHGAPGVGYFDPLQADLYETARIEVPIFPFPRPPHRLLRVSTPAYVTDDDIARLVGALRQRSRTASGEGATRG